MTSKTFALTIAAAASLCLNSCTKAFVASGPTINKSFNLTNFDHVQLDNDANLTYIADSVFSVEINAQQDILDRLIVEVNGTELEIGYKNGTLAIKHDPITITVHAPAFTGANLSGSGTIKVPSAFTTANLDIDVTGSGNISATNLKASNVTMDITGSGEITLDALEAANTAMDVSGSGDLVIANGNSEIITTKVSGSGSIQTQNVTSKTATATVTGSGKTTIQVQDKLTAKISGSGDIFVKGTPVIEQNISGSGKIIKL
jgi:Putative auto-transporter adhesin, head GIN domain